MALAVAKRFKDSLSGLLKFGFDVRCWQACIHIIIYFFLQALQRCLKLCPKNASETISEGQKLEKNLWGSIPPDPIACVRYARIIVYYPPHAFMNVI